MDMTSGLIFDFRRFSIHDGPGIRSTVFFKGCPLQCAWCHNPESQLLTPQLVHRQERCIQCGDCLAACPEGAILPNLECDPAACTLCGECARACPADARQIAGETWSAARVLAEVQKDTAFFDQSGGGVTFSGGEPLRQPEFLLDLLQACKRSGLHTALDTCGYAPWSRLEEAAPFVDLFLYDIKVMDETRHRALTGVSSRRILDNLARLSGLGKKIRLRVPLIPGCTDDDENLGSIAALAAGLPGLEGVDLLPYHASARAKYQRLGRTFPLDGLLPPEPADLARSQAIFARAGLAARIGG
jgi:pyruvate formate lyase activating enzyme